MPWRSDIPPEGARLLADLAEVRPADVRTLRDLELDWPGSRALLARLAMALNANDPDGVHDVLGRCLLGGLSAYRRSRAARDGDQRRFAAFVAGLSETLPEPDQRALVAASLSPLQQRALRLAEDEDLG
jgi:hypothetical protein